MLYREIIAVCSQIHTKHIITLCGQNVELLKVKPSVHIVTTGLYSAVGPNSNSDSLVRQTVTLCAMQFHRSFHQHHNGCVPPFHNSDALLSSRNTNRFVRIYFAVPYRSV